MARGIGVELRRRGMLYFNAVHDLEGLSDKELRALSIACRSRTQTNCFFAEYAITRPLISNIRHEQARRRRLRAELRKTAGQIVKGATT